MTKIKHSKTKDIGLIVEILSQMMTKDLLEEKDVSKYVDIFKNHFKKDSILSKEYSLYKALSECNCKNEIEANKIINDVKSYSCISFEQNKFDNSLKKLINEISTVLPLKEFFSVPIKNYKLMASIQQIINESRFSSGVDAIIEKNKIENFIVKNMIDNKKSSYKPINLKEIKSEKIDDFTYYIMLEQFNFKYKNLLPEQKNIINKYILTFDNKKDFEKFMKIEAKSINEKLDKINLQENDVLKVKYDMTKNKIKNIINENKIANDKNIFVLLRSYDLLNTLNEKK